MKATSISRINKIFGLMFLAIAVIALFIINYKMLDRPFEFPVATVDARALMAAAPNRYEFGEEPELIRRAGERFGDALQAAVETVSKEEEVIIFAAGAALSQNVPDYTNVVQLLVDRKMKEIGFPVKAGVTEQENRDATRVSLDQN
ncbi:hypothetical protein [uncultured Microbulbifer sp.]|uniref:hypothetical protein n=1 Tax=uncultured Microbulbifer sp. TaxID=348147 RepID=UPI002627A55D|nr:hypothetical protein [uncultured Microbulbifer sp.]